jgi:cellulose biosynthesis protein BcsQ
MNSSYIISVINNKGGTSKTTTSITLAQALAKEGKKILVIDNDTQANASTVLLNKGEYQKSLFDIYNDFSEDNNIDVESFIQWVEFQKNLYCIPNDPITATVEPKLIKAGTKFGFRVLKNVLRDYVLNNFDFCLIDNPPNMGLFVINSLYASDFAIVPADAGSKASIQGLIKAVQFIDDIRKEVNSNLKFLRVLLTKVDRRTSVSQVIMAQLRNNFGASRMFETVVPINTEMQKAELRDQTIFRVNPKSAGARAYREVAKEFLKILKDKT